MRKLWKESVISLEVDLSLPIGVRERMKIGACEAGTDSTCDNMSRFCYIKPFKAISEPQ